MLPHKPLILILLFLLVAAQTGEVPASAENGVGSWVVASIASSAWVCHKEGPDVKRTLKVGDVLNQGDRVFVLRGNTVQLAFVDTQNIIQLEGESVFILDSPDPTHVVLEKGKAYTFFDRLPRGSDLVVQTFAATVSARDAQYQVRVVGSRSDVMVYHGWAAVEGRPLSDEFTRTVTIRAGQKTSAAERGAPPSYAVGMSDEENEESMPIVRSVENTRRAVQPEQVKTWINEQAPPIKGSLIKGGEASEPSKEKNEQDKGAVAL